MLKIKMKDVLKLTGLTKKGIVRLVEIGDFPLPSNKMAGKDDTLWDFKEVMEWIAMRTTFEEFLKLVNETYPGWEDGRVRIKLYQ